MNARVLYRPEDLQLPTLSKEEIHRRQEKFEQERRIRKMRRIKNKAAGIWP